MTKKRPLFKPDKLGIVLSAALLAKLPGYVGYVSQANPTQTLKGNLCSDPYC